MRRSSSLRRLSGPSVPLALLLALLQPSEAAGGSGSIVRSPLAASTRLQASGPLQEAGGMAEPASRWWTRLYGAGYYDTRWDAWFLQAYAQRGYELAAGSGLSLYGIAWITGDTRSTGAPPAPVIISDNVLLAAAGLRYRPARWIWFDLQEGVAIDLVERNGRRLARGDFRFLATAGAGIYPEFRPEPGFRAPFGLLADVFASSGYYSRYDNFISYLQGRLGTRLAEGSRVFLDVYLRGDAAVDSDGEFYNNLFEIGPGLRFTPDPAWGLFLLVEYRRGYYADRTDGMRARRALFYPAQYDAVRFTLVLDRELLR